MSAHPDISQVASDDAVIHDDSLRIPERNTNLKRHGPSLVTTVRSFLRELKWTDFCPIPYFAIQDDVLTPAENWLSAHFVARRLKLKGRNNELSHKDFKIHRPTPNWDVVSQMANWLNVKFKEKQLYYRFNVFCFVVQYFR